MRFKRREYILSKTAHRLRCALRLRPLFRQQIEFLVREGAALEARDNNGYTPAFTVASWHRYAVALNAYYGGSY